MLIKKIQQDATMYQNFIIPYLYEAEHVSGDTPPIIRSLKLHWQPLGLHNTVEGCWTCSWWTLSDIRQLHIQQPSTVLCKTRGCQCSFRLLMMGGVSPETCWALCKYGIIKFWYIVASCWIFFMNCTMMHRPTSIKFNCYVFRCRRKFLVCWLNLFFK